MARDWAEVAAQIAANRVKDREARICALLGVCEDCAGLPADPLTFRKLLLLEYADNKFITGGEVTPQDVIQLLWVVSPQYSKSQKSARAFSQKIGGMEMEATVESIIEWVTGQLRDLPKGKATGEVSGRVWLAQYVDIFASEYGWTDEKIMDTPLLRLGAYKSEIVARLSGETYKEPSAANEDRIKGDWLREINRN